jgi:hypothetical protein
MASVPKSRAGPWRRPVSRPLATAPNSSPEHQTQALRRQADAARARPNPRTATTTCSKQTPSSPTKALGVFCWA